MHFDRFRRMALFAMVVRYGSFSAASRALELATSVLSTAVSQLEEELGVRLLHRTTRSLSLTEAGQPFYEKCLEMLEAANAAEDLVKEGEGEISGRLRIAAASDTAQAIVVPALAPLSKKYPNLVLDIFVNDDIVDISAQSIDLSIRSGWLEDSALVARKLTDLKEVLVASPEYLTHYALPKEPDDLKGHRIIGFRRFSEATGLTLTNQQQSIHLKVNPGAMTDNVAVIKQLLLAGVGMARIPRYFINSELMQGELVQLLPQWHLAGAGLYAVTLKRTLQPAKVRLAIQALQDYLTELE